VIDQHAAASFVRRVVAKAGQKAALKVESTSMGEIYIRAC
jgi:hypothetical protein